MATIRNDNDVLLQAASTRIVPAKLPSTVIIPSLQGINLLAPSTVFHVDTSGAALPTSITLSAILTMLSGTISFSVVTGTATLTGTTATTTTLAYADMVSSLVTIRASITVDSVTYSSDFSISKAVDGQPGVNAPLLFLTATGNSMLFDNVLDTTSTSPQISFTANLTNVSGTATFSAVAYDATDTSQGSITLGGSGNTRTLTATQFNSLGSLTTKYIKVTATLGALSDVTTVYRGDGGSDAISIVLSNEAHTLAAASDGTVGDYSTATTGVKVFQGTLDVTSLWSFSKADSSCTSTLTGSGTATVTDAVTALSADNGYVTITATRTSYPTLTKIFSLTKSIEGLSAPLLFLSATGSAYIYADTSATTSTSPTVTLTANLQNASGTATFVATAYTSAGASLGTITLGGSGNSRTLTATQFNSLGALTTAYVTVVATLSSLSDTVTLVRLNGGAIGATGSGGLTIVLSNESHTVPASSTGVVSSFSGASTTVKVFEGVTDVTASWAFSRTDSVVTSTLAGSGTATVTDTITAMSSGTDTGTVTITATRASYPTLTKIFTITKSKAGAAGSNGTNGSRGSLTVFASGSAWSDTTATNTVCDAAGVAHSTANLVIGDTCTISNGTSFASTKYWDGTVWANPGTVVNGNLLVTGSVAASAINATTLSAITANLGDVVLSAAGSMRGGQTAYNTGTGFWIGYHSASSTYRLSLGSSTKGITWDGSTFTVKGDISGASNINISGTGIFGGSSSNVNGDTTALDVNAGGGSLVGITVLGGSGAGSYAVYASANGTGGIGVYGRAGTGQIGVRGASTSSSGTGVEAIGNSTTGGGIALSMTGKLKWSNGGTGGTYYTWPLPDGNAYKVLAANGSWLDSSGAIAITAGVVGTAGALAGYVTCQRNDASGGSFKMPVYAL